MGFLADCSPKRLTVAVPVDITPGYYLIPMVISLGFGIIFSTSITLLIVPCLFNLEDITSLPLFKAIRVQH